MKITKQVIHASDVNVTTHSFIVGWGFSSATADTLITSLMSTSPVTLYKNNITEGVDYRF